MIQAVQQSTEFGQFRTDIDEWIKSFHKRVSEIEGYSALVGEANDNINHNYELILELREKMDDVKQQIQTLKLTQLIIIKKVFAEDMARAGKNPDFLKKLLGEDVDV